MWKACFVVAVVQVAVAVLVVCRGQLEKRSCWFVTDNFFCVSSYLTCSLLLTADWSSLLSYYIETVAPVVNLEVTFEYCWHWSFNSITTVVRFSFLFAEIMQK